MAKLNPMATKVRSWLRADHREWSSLISSRGDDLFLAVPLPAESRARFFLVETMYRDDVLWIGFAFKDCLYSIDTRREFREIVDGLMTDEIAFVVTRRGKWLETSLMRRNHEMPTPRPGERIEIVTWSGAWDRTLRVKARNASSRSTRRRS